jgi:DNA-binding protein WhiA
MALTTDIKDELARIAVPKSAVRAAELATILRLAGGLHLVSGKVVIEVELDSAQVARRVRKDLSELFGCESELSVISAGGIRKTSRYQIRVLGQGDTLARQTGLVDSRGRPARGLPATLVAGSIAEAQAVWRGAFLAHGSLTDPGRSAALEITAPGNEVAMALVGVARRLGVVAKPREVRGMFRVVIRDGDAI